MYTLIRVRNHSDGCSETSQVDRTDFISWHTQKLVISHWNFRQIMGLQWLYIHWLIDNVDRIFSVSIPSAWMSHLVWGYNSLRNEAGWTEYFNSMKNSEISETGFVLVHDETETFWNLSWQDVTAEVQNSHWISVPCSVLSSGCGKSQLMSLLRQVRTSNLVRLPTLSLFFNFSCWKHSILYM